MEMRSLTRCLRSRPTTSVLYTRQQTPMARQTLRFSSSDSNSNSNNDPKEGATNSPAPTTSESRPANPTNAAPSDIDSILNQLNFNSRASQASSVSRAASAASLNDPRRPYARGSGMAQTPKIDMKLGPVLGRQATVAPERGMDLSGALASLNSILFQNKVPQESRAQKYHVKRGKKLRALKSQRWRNLFKYSFQHTVAKVQRMRNQGW